MTMPARPSDSDLRKDKWGYLLADDVLTRILELCDAKTLARASRVCTHWHERAYDDILWRNLYRKRFGADEGDEEKKPPRKRQRKLVEFLSWRERYVGRIHVIDNFRRGVCTATPLENHRTAVNALHLTGDTLLSAADDATIVMWDLPSRTVIRTFSGHDSRVLTARLEGKYVLSGSDDFTVRIWDAETGAELHKLEGHTGQVECVRVHNDTVFSAAWDYSIKLWDLHRGTFIATLLGHNNWVNCMEIHSSGKFIYTGSHDTTVGIWDLDEMDLVMQLEGHTGFVSCIEVDEKNELLFSGSSDKTIRIWSVYIDEESGDHTSCPTQVIKLDSVVSCMRANAEFIAVGCWDGATRLFNHPTFQNYAHGVIARFAGAGKDGYSALLAMFQENDEEVGIRAVQLSNDFLIVGTTKFTLPYDNLILRDFRNTIAHQSSGEIICEGQGEGMLSAALLYTNKRIHPSGNRKEPQPEIPPAGCSPQTSELDLMY